MVFCMWIFWGVSFLWVISKQEGWQETRQHSSAEVSKSGKLLASGRTSNDDAGRFLVACEKGGQNPGRTVTCFFFPHQVKRLPWNGHHFYFGEGEGW